MTYRTTTGTIQTYQRQRAYREAEKLRLVMKIGIKPEDAPLYSEELRFMVYQAGLKDFSE